MFRLRVVGLLEAQQLIDEQWPTHVISLRTDPGTSTGPHHLYVQVADVHAVTPGVIYPLPEHLRQVFDFTQHLTDDDRLLVHCLAGQSRSTAIAIGVLIQHGMDCETAFATVARLRPILQPNLLFTQHIDDYFGLNNKLVELVLARRNVDPAMS